MTDVHSKDVRSRIMKSNKGKYTRSTEQRLVELFLKNKVKGWRRNYKIIGTPDFVFLRHKVAVFVDGCFWHGHDCKNTTSATNIEYWNQKRQYIANLDKKVKRALTKKGWKVIRIWECELKKQQADRSLRKVKRLLKSKSQIK